MATKRIKDLPTRSAFESDDKFVLDSATNGTGAMGKDDLLKETAENAVESYFTTAQYNLDFTGVSIIGDYRPILRQDIYTTDTTKVSVKIPDVLWDFSNITSEAPDIFACGYFDAGGITHNVKAWGKTAFLSHAGETIDMPIGYTKYYVAMRGNKGEVASFAITEKSKVEDAIKTEGRNILRTSTISLTGAGMTAKVVQVPVYGKSVVSVKIPSTFPVSTITAGSTCFAIGYYTAVTNDDSPRSTFKVITPETTSDYEGNTLVYESPTTTKSIFIFVRADSGETLDFDIVIKQQQEDCIPAIYSDIRDDKINAITKAGSIVYGTSGKPAYIEESNVPGGAIYIKFPNGVVGRGRIDVSWSMAQMASALGVSLVTSPNGEINCLQLNNARVLCINVDGTIAIKNRNAVLDTDIRIVACMDGCVSNTPLDQYYMSKIRAMEQGELVPSFQKSNSDFADSLKDVTGEVDTFLYFSDPHCLGLSGTITSAQQARLDTIFTLISTSIKTNAIDKVICGGDMLNSYDTQAEAMRKLGYFYGLSKKVIRDFWIAEGNHDTNYQGKLDSESADNTGKFSIAQQIASLFQDEGICYYSKQTNTTDFYILDTGLDSDWDMDTYRWEQVDWLANKLLAATKSHGIIVMHIYARDANSWAGSIMPFGEKVQQLVSALNARTSVTLNGNTYDFSGATQKIAVILCGHTHIDYVDTDGDIPVVAIANTDHDPNYALDACVVDYAAGKLYATRIGGYGSDRSVDIVV